MRFINRLLTGQADAIISGDRDLLEIGSHEGIPVHTPAQFLRCLRESESHSKDK